MSGHADGTRCHRVGCERETELVVHDPSSGTFSDLCRQHAAEWFDAHLAEVRDCYCLVCRGVLGSLGHARGIWEIVSHHGTRILIDHGQYRWLRMPAFHEDGRLHLVDNDGAWQKMLELSPVTIGARATIHGPEMGHYWHTSPVRDYRPLAGAVMTAENRVIVHSGDISHVHEPSACDPARHPQRRSGCWIHRPTSGHMAEWPIVWTDTARLPERLCRHAIGHPDHDALAYEQEATAHQGLRVLGGHGCDGCCVEDDD